MPTITPIATAINSPEIDGIIRFHIQMSQITNLYL